MPELVMVQPLRGIVYYTDNRLRPEINGLVQRQLLKSGLPVVSISLKPLTFGDNIVVNRKPSVISMYTQILVGLTYSRAEYIWLCEHDVLYHPSHFAFLPEEDDVYYFNVNVWRWRWPQDWFITYDHLASVSGLCGQREFLLNHYARRLELIRERGWADGRNPQWARRLGHEPGKSRKRGGQWEERSAEWRSAHPNLDLRHGNNMTPEKMTQDSFVHRPTGWREGGFDLIDGWSKEELWPPFP
jgi:hypothetical protein